MSHNHERVFNHNLEERCSLDDLQKYNKFNMEFRNMNSRKCSKDSSNISTSIEDVMDKEAPPIPNQLVNNNTNNSIFKGKASDFKIKYKTELCKYFEIYGQCAYGVNCAFAHGVENLRSKVTNSTYYRTRKCTQFFEKGYCPYGNRCQFKHQLNSNIINNPYDRKMSYQKILQTISKLENINNIKKLIDKPRLKVFQDIINNKDINQKESRLLNDIKKLKSENIM